MIKYNFPRFNNLILGFVLPILLLLALGNIFTLGSTQAAFDTQPTFADISKENEAANVAVNGDILYVQAGTANDCGSWATSCELQTALNLAAEGDEIWVAQGIHKPSLDLAGLTDFTFAAWIYWEGEDVGNWQRIFDFGDGIPDADTGSYMFLTLDNRKPRFAITDAGYNGETRLDATEPLTTSQWVHVAVTLQGITGTIYIDGVANAITNTITLRPRDVVGENSWLGKSQFPSDPTFNGRFDEVAIFNRALSPAEIQTIKESGWENTSGKVVALHMEESPAITGTLITDNSGWLNHALLLSDDSNDKSIEGYNGQALYLDGAGDYLSLDVDVTTSFHLKSGVSIYGGFVATETAREQRDWQNNVTVLSGDIDNNDETDAYGVVTTTNHISGTNADHVVISNSPVTETAVLDGFTITAGKDMSYEVVRRGAGILIDNSDPTLTHIIFRGNLAEGTERNDGGGMYNEYSNPSLHDVTFIDNSADNGGGMYNEYSNPSLHDVTFIDNSADKGGGMYNGYSNPSLHDVTFIDNLAGLGGGIYNSSSNPMLTNVTLEDNSASSNGGGMYNAFSSIPMLINVNFKGNSADSGGGMYNASSSPMLINVNFKGNSADSGGGMYNSSSSPELVNVAFNSNMATDSGGGMLNKGSVSQSSEPVLTNVTFSANVAGDLGGGMYNFGTFFFEDPYYSNPTLINCIMWGNIANQSPNQIDNGILATPNISSTIIEGSGGSGLGNWDTTLGIDNGNNIDEDPSFVRNPDPNTDDFGDLHLQLGSPAIDAGDNTAVPADTFDLDGDGNITETLPYDLDGNPRIFGDEDLDKTIDITATVDMGAYEGRCFPYYMYYAGGKLVEGRDYRQGFHTTIVDPATIAETLIAYAAERSQGNLDVALNLYGYSLGCAATVTETQAAVEGMQNVIWEQATGAMLEGNDAMVAALDLTDAEDIASEINLLREVAIPKYNKAITGYLNLLTSDQFPHFLYNQPERVDPINGQIAPYLDIIRLAEAAGKKGRAYLELAERQFRQGNQAQAEVTLRQSHAQAAIELALLETLWPSVIDEVGYQDIIRNMSDMERLFAFMLEDKNPLGYSPEFIPMYYRPDTGLNNYEETKAKADEFLNYAQEDIDDAAMESEKVDDDYELMQVRYDDINNRYEDELETLCGLNDQGEVDLFGCRTGQIGIQINAVDQALLHVERTLQQMHNLDAEIDILVQARAEAAGIYDYTAELINPETSEKFTSMVEQEKELSAGDEIANVGRTLLGGFMSGAKGFGGFGTKSAKAGGIFGAVDSLLGIFGIGDTGPSREERLQEFQAWQEAQVLICDGQIQDLEFETKIKTKFLDYGTLSIDYAIAVDNLEQELVRLDAMKTRVEYLLAEQAEATAFTRLLYEDPAHRVMRDYYMELAQGSYDNALDYAYQASRTLEYEANQTYSELGSSDPDAIYGIRNVDFLGAELQEMTDAYYQWTQDRGVPEEYETIVHLSRALGFEDMELPDIGPVSREEQFNAFLRDPSNRVDLDKDGIDESLRFNFHTSIHTLNPFFLTLVYNDRIETVKMRVHGDQLGLNEVAASLTWGDSTCRESQCSSAFIRTENAFQNGGPDDLRVYNLPSKTTVLIAPTNNNPFQIGSERNALAMRSVANASWTFTIDMSQGPNQGFNLDGIDEIELIIRHHAYALQLSGLSLQQFEPPLTRAYQPAVKQLTLQEFRPYLGEQQEQQLLVTEPISVTGAFAGIAAADFPHYMPAINLSLVLTETEGSLSGYLPANLGLSYPLMNGDTQKGPALTGFWDGEQLNLYSEPFSTTHSAELTLTRQVSLTNVTVIYTDTGQTLAGHYQESLTGLSQLPLTVSGRFTVTRPRNLLAPAAVFNAQPTKGVPPLTVQFNDMSSNQPSSWTWDFGDGITSTEQHPVHIYSQDGDFTVSLTVSNEYGSDILEKIAYIKVGGYRLYLPTVTKR